jgi:hypothetical protein
VILLKKPAVVPSYAGLVSLFSYSTNAPCFMGGGGRGWPG